MHFEVDVTVTIAGKIVQTIHTIKTKYDSTHIGSYCDISLPLNSLIQYQDGTHDFLTSYLVGNVTQLFKVGDIVQVTGSYTTEAGIQLPTVTLFKGYVWEFKQGTPCTIRCIDYLPLLGHLRTISNYTGTMKNLITSILAGTGISMILPTLDLTLVKITFKQMSPWGILDYLKKNIGINISLSGTNLYVNVASNTLDNVIFDSRVNVHMCNLQQPETVWQGYRVKAWFIGNNGLRTSLELGDPEGHIAEVYFYKVQGGLPVYNKMAAEALNKVRQRKFSGQVGTLLYPVVQLFDKISYTDYRYPERSGNYVCTAISHSVDEKGILVDMRWAFLTDFLNQVS